MIDSADLLQIVCAAFVLFISLLPISFMSWRDRLLDSVRREAALLGGLDSWMLETGNELITFVGPFSIANPKVTVSIHEIPLSVARLQKKLSGKAMLESTSHHSPIDSIVDGFNEIANLCLRRGHRMFAMMLILDSSLFVASVLVVIFGVANGNEVLVLSTFIIFGVFSYLVYPLSFFSERVIGWNVPPTMKKDGTATVGMVSALWHKQ